MRRYTQLAREQRDQIYALKKAGHSHTRITDLLDVHKSTINWELRRNCGHGVIARSRRTCWPNKGIGRNHVQ
jgi:IS30 family transposase